MPGQITVQGNATSGSGSIVLATGATLVSPIIQGGTSTQNVTTIPGDGAITITPGTVVLSKGSAAAITLAAPASQDGTKITVTSTTAFAHVITFPATTLFNGTTGAKTTATFAAFKGASVVFIAIGTSWLVEAVNNVTIG